jgi:23S rRNA (adenine-N6)-dimethyltransferase
VSANARTHWGFHRLADDWAGRLVAFAGVRLGHLVLDIGAGTGAITGPLLEAGARVIAFELHPARARSLRDRFASSPVTVVQADAADLRLPRRPFRVVANPPFAVTTPLLRRLVQPGSRLVRADLVVDRRVAERWSTGRAPGHNRWGRTVAATVGFRLPRRAFVPTASVDTAVLTLVRRS